MENIEIEESQPKTLGTFIVLEDGSIGFTLEVEGLRVLIENNLEKDRVLEMMHNTVERAFSDRDHSH